MDDMLLDNEVDNPIICVTRVHILVPKHFIILQ